MGVKVGGPGRKQGGETIIKTHCMKSICFKLKIRKKLVNKDSYQFEVCKLNLGRISQITCLQTPPHTTSASSIIFWPTVSPLPDLN